VYPFTLPIQNNPLRTRADMQLAVEQLCRPLLPYFTPGRTRVRLGATSSGSPDGTSALEGFSRLLWGLAPHAAGGADIELWEAIREGIRNGTDPEHPEYWGEAADYDQMLVEMSAMGFAMALAPDRIWTPLSASERERFARWLGQMNERKLHDCNWLLFGVVVNLGFRAVGLPYDRELMERNLARVDTFYLSDGWYADGPKGHCDYYGPFAIHYFGLLYAALMEREDPARSALYKERAAAFASSFVHWFAADGSALPYGRSLTYRFCQAAFWGALAYAGVDALPMGVLKGLVLRNLRWWFKQPVFQPDGTLTIGYAYPNLIMGENYNAPGSPYWAMKAFLPLALPAAHPFWQAEELPLPPLPARAVQVAPGMIVCRRDDHVVAFNAGHGTTNEHTHAAAKYEKFAYSNRFGFSVPRGGWGLAQGAFDSMLALSEGDNLYRAKRTAKERAVRDGVLLTVWEPWRDVEVRTWLIAGAPWHVRVHCIRTTRELDAADGGFALGIEDRYERIEEGGAAAAAASPHGMSGIVPLLGGGEAKLVFPQANTNVLHARTAIPTAVFRLRPGTHWIASAIYGEPGEEDCARAWNAPPAAAVDGNELVVRLCVDGDGESFRIPLAEHGGPR